MIRQVSISLMLVAALLTSGYSQNISVEPEKVLTVEDQLDRRNKIEVYPNPAVDFLIVQVDTDELRNVEFEVRSLLGSEMLVQAEDLGSGRFRFSVKDFSIGYYFVVVKDEEARFKKAYRFLKSN